jgi:hypothetical protein
MQSFSKQAPALTNSRCCGISCSVWLTESVSGCDHRAQLLETHFRAGGADLLSYEIIYKLPPLFVLKGFVFGHWGAPTAYILSSRNSFVACTLVLS